MGDTMQDERHMEIEATEAEREDMRSLSDEIIDPLTFKITLDLEEKKVSAINYDTSWVSSVNIGDTRGSWKIAPQLQLTEEGKKLQKEEGYKALTEEHVARNGKNVKQFRSYSIKFYQTLERLVEANKIPWFKMNEDGETRFLRLNGSGGWEATDTLLYYFTHAQGVAAREKYEELVLEGKIRANKVSWTNKHSKLTGMAYEDLEKKFPEVYATSTTPKKKASDDAQAFQASSVDILEMDLEGNTSTPPSQELIEPTDTEMFGEDSEADTEDEESEEETAMDPLDQLEGPTEDELVEEEESEVETVGTAGASMTAPILSDKEIAQIHSDENARVLTMPLRGFEDEANPPRVSEDCFVKHIEGEDVKYYEIDLPFLHYPIWIPGNTALNLEGTVYDFVTEEDDDSEES